MGRYLTVSDDGDGIGTFEIDEVCGDNGDGIWNGRDCRRWDFCRSRNGMPQAVERRYPKAFRRFVHCSSMCCIGAFIIYIVLLLLESHKYQCPPIIYDVVVFGATPAGCAAAIAAGEMGATVILLEPSGHVGGMATEGGIGLRDEMDNRRVTDPKHSQVRWGTLNALFYEGNKGTIPIWQPDNYVGERSFLQLLDGAGVEIRFHTTFIEGRSGVLMDTVAPIEQPRIHSLFLQDSAPPGSLDDSSAGDLRSGKSKNGKEASFSAISSKAPPPVDCVRGRFFIDATYEGDLMKAAGVSFTYGRESSHKYNESQAGVTGKSAAKFPDGISPFLQQPEDKGTIGGTETAGTDERLYNGTTFYYDQNVEGNLLRYVLLGPDPRKHVGEADDNVMAYSYRVCFTQDPNNMVPVTQPLGYNPIDFELARRLVLAEVAAIDEKRPNYDSISRPWILYPYNRYDNTNRTFMKFDACCGNSPFGIDAPGLALGYANASRSERQRIVREHRYFVQGLLWFWQTDPAVPETIREEYKTYGLCRDEFADNGHFPRQLYVREAARMVGDNVFTQNDANHKDCRQDSIAIATWWFDIHDVQRVAVPVERPETLSSPTTTNEVNETRQASPTTTSSWMVMNEGLVSPDSTDLSFTVPFDLPYWLLLPKRGEITNLAVPNCPSVSHVAFSAIREEPTLWLLGQAAGIAAAIAALSTGNPTFHDVNITVLQEELRKQGSPIHWPADREC